MYMANIVHLGTRITKIVDVKLSKLKFFPSFFAATKTCHFTAKIHVFH